ncbi:MAG TPA: penicillin-binding protein 2, partial [Clostridiales bacterium]|nr:penicillin-binding protein 2 [Clostridiales bacterium]
MERRLAVYTLVLILVFLSIGGRLAYVQVVRGEHFSELAQMNRIRIIPLTAPRGNIYDRHGRLLVTNRPSFTVSIMELEEEHTDTTVRELARILGVPEEEIRAKIEKHLRPFEPVRIATD